MVAKTGALATPIVVAASRSNDRPPTSPTGIRQARERLHGLLENIETNLETVTSAFFDPDRPDLTDGIYDEDEDLPQKK